MSDVARIINNLLDTYRQEHGISSDEVLATKLQVSDQTIYRWRRGNTDKGARVLLPLAIKQARHSTPDSSTPLSVAQPD